MYSHPESLLNSIMELMRYIAMPGANRDPRVFDEPERLDLTCNQDANVTFAPGTHHCIGHLFAKMQLTEFFGEFLQRYRSFDVLDEELQFAGALTFRGPLALHLRLQPR